MMPDKKTLSMMLAFGLRKEAWFFLRWAALLMLIAVFSSVYLVAIVTLGTLGIVAFFRNPHRVPPTHDKAIVSPADGLVVDISPVGAPPSYLSMPATEYHKVSIFLSVLDVHVNRMPISGKIAQRVHKPGTFKNAADEDAGLTNEQLGIVIDGDVCVGCVQIAGLLARRIVCDVEENQEVQRGQEYGVICFGSRVECYIPSSCTLCVEKGQRMVGGESWLAIMP